MGKLIDVKKNILCFVTAILILAAVIFVVVGVINGWAGLWFGLAGLGCLGIAGYILVFHLVE